MQFLATLLLVILVGFVFAAMSVTQECRRMAIANCRRLNGTWSLDRLRRELAAFQDYIGNLAVPLALPVLLSLVVSQFVIQNLMPADQIIEAFAEYSTDGIEWKDRLQDLGHEHQEWLARNGIAGGEEAEQFQRTLWYGWPLLVVVTLSFCIFCVWGMLGVSRLAVFEYVSGVRSRRTDYARFDVNRMMMPPDTDQFP